MKVIMEGKAKQCPVAIGMLTEDALLNPSIANERLSQFNLKIDRIETVNGEKVIYIKESVSNLLCG